MWDTTPGEVRSLLPKVFRGLGLWVVLRHARVSENLGAFFVSFYYGPCCLGL